MYHTNRQQRRRFVTIAPNLVPLYNVLCDYYGVSRSDTTTIFNLCLHTVGKALLNKQQGETTHGSLQTTTDTSSGTSGT